jgi:hypothetical protein
MGRWLPELGVNHRGPHCAVSCKVVPNQRVLQKSLLSSLQTEQQLRGMAVVLTEFYICTGCIILISSYLEVAPESVRVKTVLEDLSNLKYSNESVINLSR